MEYTYVSNYEEYIQYHLYALKFSSKNTVKRISLSALWILSLIIMLYIQSICIHSIRPSLSCTFIFLSILPLLLSLYSLYRTWNYTFGYTKYIRQILLRAKDKAHFFNNASIKVVVKNHRLKINVKKVLEDQTFTLCHTLKAITRIEETDLLLIFYKRNEYMPSAYIPKRIFRDEEEKKFFIEEVKERRHE